METGSVIAPGLRWGLAGYGDLAEKRLVEALSTPPHRLAAVWGRDLKRAQQFAERFKIPSPARSLNALLAAVDAVYVAVPPVARVPVAMAAVEAGRHVLIEKPLCPTFPGYEALSAAVEERHITAAVAYYRRFAPALARLRALLTTGALGAIRDAHVNFARTYQPRADDPKAWRLDPSVAGSGVLADAGCHRLDLLCWLLGPGRVKYLVSDRKAPSQIERVVEMTIEYHRGGTAQCRFSWDDSFADRLVLQGEKGIATLDPLDKGRLVIDCEGGPRQEEAWPVGNLHVDLVQAFGRAMIGAPTALCTLAEARHVDVLIEAAVAV